MDALPPPPPALQTAECRPSQSQKDADAALKALVQNLPKTRFTKAWPACMPGLIAVELADGKVAYTDTAGRYLIVGLVLDTATGKALDRQLEGRND